jgi:23S rRNA pseudouridine955/2504/2580 synthase
MNPGPGTGAASQPVRYLTIDADEAGQRVDNFLAARLRGVPRAHLYRILRRGEVRVNKGRVRQDYRLQAGDRVRIPPLRSPSQPPATPGAPDQAVRAVAASLLYEDANVLVLDKPAGIPVHGGTAHSHGVIDALRVLRREAPFLELAHRLDRETSGCLLVAKSRHALRSLHESLRGHRVHKRYLLLVCGAWEGGKRQVALALRKNALKGGERVVTLDPGGKTALTHLAPVSVSPAASLLRARTVTGRTHQIRVHAAAVGHPIAGDTKYGDRACNRSMKGLGLGRLFLHADSVSFPDPDSGATVHVEAPLPAELGGVLAALGLRTRSRGGAPADAEARRPQ